MRVANIQFHPAAADELEAAHAFYEQRNPAAAHRFVVEIRRVLDLIAARAAPLAGRVDPHSCLGPAAGCGRASIRPGSVGGGGCSHDGLSS